MVVFLFFSFTSAQLALEALGRARCIENQLEQSKVNITNGDNNQYQRIATNSCENSSSKETELLQDTVSAKCHSLFVNILTKLTVIVLYISIY